MKAEESPMREEYDFSRASRSPYAARIKEYGSNIVSIDPDLFTLFPDSDAVNSALRDYVRMRKAGGTAIPADGDQRKAS